jgi:hypothetical protein
MGQGSELLALVMTSTMGPEQQAVKRDLDGVADKTRSDSGSDEAVADAIAGAREADRSVLVHDPQHLATLVGGAGRQGRRSILSSSSIR